MSRGLNKPIRINLTAARGGFGELTEIAGKYIRVVDASSAGAECAIALRGEFNTTFFRFVDQAWLYEAQGFDGIHILNDAQAGEWLEIVITDGPDDFDYERPTNNNIGEIVSDVKVVNPLGEELNVNVDLLKNDRLQRAPLTSLQGASWAYITGASSTVVSSGANVNGVIIRYIRAVQSGGTPLTVTIGGNNFIVGKSGAYGPEVFVIENIFVPAGQAVAVTSSAGDNICIAYEVL